MAPLSGDDPRHLGGFRVLTLLAVGGMGRVYLALGPDRQAVALKVARPEFAADARFRARFRREVDTARGIGGGDTDLIAPVVAADAEAELPWLASEYVPGPSVTDAVMGPGPLADAGLRTLTHGLALALTEVHAAGVVHRDVKPSNVLLARGGPRLIDFGVARAIDDVTLTRVGALIGSPGFLSPEQAVGEPATFASDVFAMAAVVGYAARGQSPFGAGDGPALLYRVVHEAPKLDGLPADLAELLAACLAKDPAERPSAPEIAAGVAPEVDWLPEAVLDDIARREAELAAWLEVTARVRPIPPPPTPAFDKVADSALDIANAAPALPTRVGVRRRRGGAGNAPGLDRRVKPRGNQGAEPGEKPNTEHPANAAPPALSLRPEGTRQPGGTASPAVNSRPEGIREPGLPRSGSQPTEDIEDIREQDSSTTKPGAAYTAFLLDPTADPDPTAEPDPSPADTHPTHRRTPRRRRFPLYAALGALLGAAAAAGILLLPHAHHAAPPPPLGPASSVSGSAGKPKAASPTPGGARSGSETSAATSASGSRR